MDKKQFILDTLLPYKENRELCAIDIDETGIKICKYLDDKGNKCAVGKHLIPGKHQYFQGNASSLDTRYGLDTILTEEAKKQRISLREWKLMQSYHDNVGLEKDKNIINNGVDLLETATGLELNELKFAS